MSDRVLNFSEFADKYSTAGASSGKDLDSILQSAANFEEGFDKETYDQKPLGPQRPVAGGLESTPPQPGEVGSPKFSTSQDSEMEAPTEEEQVEEEPVQIEKTDETPEPEAGANPKKEENTMSESKKSGKVLGFNEFLNESGWSHFSSMHNEDDPFAEKEYGQEHDHEHEYAEDWDETEHDEHEEHEYEEDELACPKCGEPMSVTSAGYTCGCNM